MDALDLAEFPDEQTKLRQQMIGVKQDIGQLFAAQDVADKLALGNVIRSAAHGRSHMTLQLSTITILIDAGLISIDDVVARIEQIQSSLAEQLPGYADPMVQAGVKFATDWLLAHKKQRRRSWKPVIVPCAPDERAKSGDHSKDT